MANHLQITCLHLQLQWLVRQPIGFLQNSLPAISESKQRIKASGARAQMFTSSTPERLGGQTLPLEWEQVGMHLPFMAILQYDMSSTLGPNIMDLSLSMVFQVDAFSGWPLSNMFRADGCWIWRATKVAKIQNMTQLQLKDSSALQRLWVINRFT